MHYNDPDISALDFLYAVMREPSLPLTQRIEAAGKLMLIEPNGPPEPSITIRISGNVALHAQALFESFSDELKRDLMYLKRCYEAGFSGPFDIADMEVKGRG